MMLDILLQSNAPVYVLNGLSRGMIIFLVASGLTIIFGLVGLINFAHGAVVTAGAYMAMSLVGATGSYIAGVAGAVVFIIAVSLFFERTLIYLLYEKPLMGFLATFGMGLVIEEVIKFIWGSQTYSLEAPITGSVSLLGVTYPSYRLFVIAVGLVVAALIGALLQYTRFGLEIYATAVDEHTAETLGVSTRDIFSAAFVLGIFLAVLAGALVAPITTISPTLGLEYMIIAFLVILLGGMGSFKGTFITSLVVGIYISVTSIYVRPTYALISVFVLSMMFILARPTGLYGKKKVIE